MLLTKSRSSSRNDHPYTEKWVVNHSFRDLTPQEKSVLSRGLNFAPAPTKVPIPEIIVAVEDGLRKIRSAEALARTNIIGVLSNTRPPPSNLSPDDVKAVKDLKKDESIITTSR